MKQCPKCSKQYADEAGFCLQDGTQLVSAASANDVAPNNFAPVSTPFQPWSQPPLQPPQVVQQAQVSQAQTPPNVDAGSVGAANSNGGNDVGGRLKNSKKSYRIAAVVLLVVLVLLWTAGRGGTFVFFGLFVIEMILVGVIFSAGKSQKS